jgi:hypothetical protein
MMGVDADHESGDPEAEDDEAGERGPHLASVSELVGEAPLLDADAISERWSTAATSASAARHAVTACSSAMVLLEPKRPELKTRVVAGYRRLRKWAFTRDTRPLRTSAQRGAWPLQPALQPLKAQPFAARAVSASVVPGAPYGITPCPVWRDIQLMCLRPRR